MRIIILAIVWLLVAMPGVFAGPQVIGDDLRTDTVLDLSIMGPPLATKEQCLQHLLGRNPLPALTVPAEELVNYYYEEAMTEGVRPDVAFAQALHETGYFRYGGDVIPLQNNFSGLGTVGNGARGVWFSSAQIGVRAQIQHLLGYASAAAPKQAIVDPRYSLLKTSKYFGSARTWTELNGKWAIPGKTYGQKILRIHEQIMREKPVA
ncbi:glucosaminidase domain-containing protein [Sporomusa aerivorans]|uniref:glucosaminidase domain-containing protein n=1 Tax=Sporomusa aerivorans TaxID=204936 RepID=UPI00352AFF63